MTTNREYAYDLEVFPNFFSVTFINCDTEEVHRFVLSEYADDRAEMAKFLDGKLTLYGFNNLSYDGPILYYVAHQAILHPAHKVLPALFPLSMAIIDDDKRYADKLKILRAAELAKYNQVDLMRIGNFDMQGVGLKQVAINLDYPVIQDLPYEYDQDISLDEIDDVLKYNENDVQVTLELYRAMKPMITLRQELSKLYRSNLINSSDSRMANVILEKIYSEKTKVDLKELRELRTERETVSPAECVARNIEFKTDALKQLLSDISKLTLTWRNDFAYKYSVKINETTYDLGVGGLHSRDNASKFVSDDDYIIRDADVASYYPSIMIMNRIKPEHLDEKFIDILSQITADRLAAKRSGDKSKADGLKITINSIFGKLGSNTFWLQDSKAFLSVTINGQLYLLMLIEALESAGIQVISANTDGIVCRIPRQLESVYSDVCAEWQQKTGFTLEFSEYSLYVRSDVNNYLMQSVDGKIKTKGKYVSGISLNKSYHHPIVAKAVCNYYIHGTPVEDTIRSSTSIYDFCVSPKARGDFKFKLHTGRAIIDLQKNNRFFISNRGGYLIKHNTQDNRQIGVFAGKCVKLLNNCRDTSPTAYDVNYGFYIAEAQKIIDEVIGVDDGQLSLFGS